MSPQPQWFMHSHDFLTPEQKRRCVCKDLYLGAQDDPDFVLRMITSGKSYVSEPETTQ